MVAIGGSYCQGCNPKLTMLVSDESILIDHGFLPPFVYNVAQFRDLKVCLVHLNCPAR